jgi:hypothetical protein
MSIPSSVYYSALLDQAEHVTRSSFVRASLVNLEPPPHGNPSGVEIS